MDSRRRRWIASIQGEPLQCEGPLTVREILQRLQDTYCRSIGVQFMHIDNFEIRRWLQQRMEGTGNRLELTRDEQIRILTRLTDAVMFEEFIRKKFVGAKTFSLEGCESLIPLLDLAIEKAAEQGVREIVLGMAHRGRLTCWPTSWAKARARFSANLPTDPKLFRGHGDVKYHLGHSNDWTTAAGPADPSLAVFQSQPSGIREPGGAGPRARQTDRASQGRRRHRPEPAACLALLIHGDAALPAKGVVQETLNLSQLPGYTVGGTLHVVVNNQIGFTTPPGEGRSSIYATDVAQMLQVPIFHVNGEDPEAVAQVVQIAMDFRANSIATFSLTCSATGGWAITKGDEPSFTQPVLYRAIAQRKSVREGYLDHLLNLGGLTPRGSGRNRAPPPRSAGAGTVAGAGGRRPDPPGGKVRGVWTRGNYIGRPGKKRGRPRHRRRGRAGWPNCLSSRRNCRRVFIRIRKSKSSWKAGAKWPRANSRWIGPRPKPWLSPP